MTFEQSVLTCVSLAAVAVMAAMGVVVCVTEFHLPAIRQSLSASTLSGWRFPFGGGEYDSIWALVWGELRFVLGDASTEISAVGSPMSAVPYRSRLWIADGTDGSRLVTWEDFALNRDPDTPINAQIVLFRNGDFVTRSNDVETVFRRVDPEDWDDDGIPNVDDPHPYSSDGDFFGPRQSLPAGANADAYCWVELVSEVNSHVTFTGDGPSDLPDPDFMVRAGEINRVILLIGKTYSVASSRPVSVVAKSDPAIEVTGDGTCGLGICWPVGVSVAESEGGCFTMRVTPGRVGGTFSWNSECCPVSGSGRSFFFDCGWRCLCIGCTAYGTFVYEGYSLPVSGGECGCSPGPRPCRTAPDDQMVAGVSASFSPGAVIFEDAYTNMPGEVVGRRSTEAVLTCSVHGGFRGGTASFSFTGSDRLGWVRGAAVPQTTVTIPAGEKLEFAAAYEGMSPSESVDDVVFAVTFIENDVPGEPLTVEARLTSVKVELTASYNAVDNPSKHRHVFGVGEELELKSIPALEGVIATATLGTLSDMQNGLAKYVAPSEGDSTVLSICYGGVHDEITIDIFEPEGYVVYSITTNFYHAPNEAGLIELNFDNRVFPTCVSFYAIEVTEIPMVSTNATGYFSQPEHADDLDHGKRGAYGQWSRINEDNSTVDFVQMGYCPKPWNGGGSYTWPVPNAWRVAGSGLTTNVFTYTDQRFELDADGTARVSKFGWTGERRTNDLGRVYREISI